MIETLYTALSEYGLVGVIIGFMMWIVIYFIKQNTDVIKQNTRALTLFIDKMHKCDERR